eukprot:4108542-Amphidinium_carterae.1
MGRETGHPVPGRPFASQTTWNSWQLAVETSRQRSSSRNQDKPRKDMAGWAWHCTSCECYNFGYRTSCFRCSEPQGNAKFFKTLGPAGKSGSPAPRTPRQQAGNRQSGQPAGGTNRSGEPVNQTRSGPNPPNGKNALLTEQMLQKQIKAVKDDPILKE